MEQTVKITDVKTEDVELIFPQVKEHLEEALRYGLGEYSIDDIYIGLVTGLMHLWIAYETGGKIKASAVCEIRNFPQKKVCHILLMGGQDMASWFHAHEAVEEWAQENGADVMTAYTRKGMVKLVGHLGYTEQYMVITKELTERRLH